MKHSRGKDSRILRGAVCVGLRGAGLFPIPLLIFLPLKALCLRFIWLIRFQLLGQYLFPFKFFFFFN